MWCHLPTGISRRRLLQFLAVASLVIAFFTTLVFAHATQAAEGVNQTLSFQGRLAQSTGALVADGHYNIQFKIYQDGPGSSAGNPGGTLKWTETYTNNNADEGVDVKNGYFSVTLGSKNPFGNQIDWNQDTLWLSMNIAGSNASCSTFGETGCAADGEMLPMKRLTATPFAINSAQLDGKTADNFIQLAQGLQEDASTNTPSIAINKTGSGNFLQLQNNGVNALSVTNSGNLEFGNAQDHAIYVGGAGENASGRNLTLFAGWGGWGTSGGNGGTLFLQGGGAGGDGNSNGGDVVITGGSKTGNGASGSIFLGADSTSNIQVGSANLGSGTQTINIGNNSSGGTTNITIGSGSGASSGSTKIQSKDTVAISTNGVDRATFDSNGNLYLGNGVTSSDPSDFKIQGTDSTANGVSGGDLTIQGGGATTGNTNGGNLVLNGGSGNGTGTNGSVSIGTSNTGDVNIGSSTGGSVNIQSGESGVTVQSGGVVSASFNAANVQIGDGSTVGTPTVLTLDKASSVPSVDASLVGSMYYDTTLGKVQCYEADGWGACGAAPDTFVSMSPEYAGGIVTGSGTGTVSTGVCSDDLNINDGSSASPTICGTHETQNYYNWTSPSSTSQYKVIYITSQLPSNFDKFVSGSTSLMGRTDSSDSQVSYYLYRIKGDGSGTVTCNSSEFFVSTGVQSTWQKAVGTGTADPANCGFTAGDRIMFKIAVGSKNSANAYVSDLNYAYSLK